MTPPSQPPQPPSDPSRRSQTVARTVAVLLLPVVVAVVAHLWPSSPRQSWWAGTAPHLETFSPDGKTLVTTDASLAQDHGYLVSGAPVRLWDVATGRERCTLAETRLAIEGLAFSPDGSLLAAQDVNHQFKLWDAATGEEKADLTGGPSRIHFASFCFSPDGRRPRWAFLCDHLPSRWGGAASPVPVARLWSTRMGREVGTLEGNCPQALFSPDGNTLATVTVGGTVQVWDVPPRKPLGALLALSFLAWAFFALSVWVWTGRPSSTGCCRRQA